MKPKGPVESFTGPTRLRSRLLSVDGEPRIAGYGVQSDLAQHHSFIDVVFLSCTTRLPSAAERRVLEVVVMFLSAVRAGSAPVHAAVLMKMCDSKSFIGGAAAMLSESARVLLERHEDLRSWLAAELRTSRSRCPAQYRATTSESRRSTRRLLEAVGSAVVVATVPKGMTSEGTIIALLHGIGIRDYDQLVLLFVLAGLPATVGEALLTPTKSFGSYPIMLPNFEYASVR